MARFALAPPQLCSQRLTTRPELGLIPSCFGYCRRASSSPGTGPPSCFSLHCTTFTHRQSQQILGLTIYQAHWVVWGQKQQQQQQMPYAGDCPPGPRRAPKEGWRTEGLRKQQRPLQQLQQQQNISVGQAGVSYAQEMQGPLDSAATLQYTRDAYALDAAAAAARQHEETRHQQQLLQQQQQLLQQQHLQQQQALDPYGTSVAAYEAAYAAAAAAAAPSLYNSIGPAAAAATSTALQQLQHLQQLQQMGVPAQLGHLQPYCLGDMGPIASQQQLQQLQQQQLQQPQQLLPQVPMLYAVQQPTGSPLDLQQQQALVLQQQLQQLQLQQHIQQQDAYLQQPPYAYSLAQQTKLSAAYGVPAALIPQMQQLQQQQLQALQQQQLQQQQKLHENVKQSQQQDVQQHVVTMDPSQQQQRQQAASAIENGAALGTAPAEQQKSNHGEPAAPTTLQPPASQQQQQKSRSQSAESQQEQQHQQQQQQKSVENGRFRQAAQGANRRATSRGRGPKASRSNAADHSSTPNTARAATYYCSSSETAQQQQPQNQHQHESSVVASSPASSATTPTERIQQGGQQQQQQASRRHLGRGPVNDSRDSPPENLSRRRSSHTEGVRGQQLQQQPHQQHRGDASQRQSATAAAVAQQHARHDRSAARQQQQPEQQQQSQQQQGGRHELVSRLSPQQYHRSQQQRQPQQQQLVLRRRSSWQDAGGAGMLPDSRGYQEGSQQMQQGPRGGGPTATAAGTPRGEAVRLQVAQRQDSRQRQQPLNRQQQQPQRGSWDGVHSWAAIHGTSNSRGCHQEGLSGSAEGDEAPRGAPSVGSQGASSGRHFEGGRQRRGGRQQHNRFVGAPPVDAYFGGTADGGKCLRAGGPSSVGRYGTSQSSSSNAPLKNADDQVSEGVIVFAGAGRGTDSRMQSGATGASQGPPVRQRDLQQEEALDRRILAIRASNREVDKRHRIAEQERQAARRLDEAAAAAARAAERSRQGPSSRLVPVTEGLHLRSSSSNSSSSTTETRTEARSAVTDHAGPDSAAQTAATTAATSGLPSRVRAGRANETPEEAVECSKAQAAVSGGSLATKGASRDASDTATARRPQQHRQHQQQISRSAHAAGSTGEGFSVPKGRTTRSISSGDPRSNSSSSNGNGLDGGASGAALNQHQGRRQLPETELQQQHQSLTRKQVDGAAAGPPRERRSKQSINRRHDQQQPQQGGDTVPRPTCSSNSSWRAQGSHGKVFKSTQRSESASAATQLPEGGLEGATSAPSLSPGRTVPEMPLPAAAGER
ncbi:hypothetical protein Emag_006619 [Eimeria magna]